MTVRKAFTLVEMLLVIAIIPLVAAALGKMLATVISEVPRAGKVVHENTTLLNMFSELRRDIDNAKSLPKSYNEQTSDDALLLIESANGVLYYKLEGGQVIKGRLPQEDSSEQRLWRLPKSVVRWSLLSDNGEPYAVEVTNHIAYKSSGKLKQAMANTYVFFIGATGGSSK